MEPEHTATATEPSVSLNLDYNSVVDVAFLRRAAVEGLTTILGGGWITRSSIDGAPGEVLAEADYFHSARDEALVRLPEGICQLILSERSLIVRIAARDRASAMRVRGEVLAALPEVESGDREVPVRFWWWQPAVARDLARMLPSPSWREIEENYVELTREQLSGLMGWRDAPPAGGRLLLWHGEPGTGKTSAIRSLTGEWRSWAEFHFVTDPEEFLRNPSYLLSTLSDRRTSQTSGPADRWKVLVLEDSGEYLVPEAKHVEGQALSRLLNICDGVLGQAMRALVLVTTNEPLRTLHRGGELRAVRRIRYRPLDRRSGWRAAGGHKRHPRRALRLRGGSLGGPPRAPAGRVRRGEVSSVTPRRNPSVGATASRLVGAGKPDSAPGLHE
jgi:hypothetical protein